jgi:hypothetical protein
MRDLRAGIKKAKDQLSNKIRGITGTLYLGRTRSKVTNVIEDELPITEEELREEIRESEESLEMFSQEIKDYKEKMKLPKYPLGVSLWDAAEIYHMEKESREA